MYHQFAPNPITNIIINTIAIPYDQKTDIPTDNNPNNINGKIQPIIGIKYK